MNKVFKKIIEKQEELFQDLNVIEVLSHVDFDSTIQNSLENFLKAITNEAIEIVKQEAAEYEECYKENVKKMKIIIDIPNEFTGDYIADKFKDFFSRVVADIDCKGLCGNYEKEIAEMFIKAFENSEYEYGNGGK